MSARYWYKIFAVVAAAAVLIGLAAYIYNPGAVKAAVRSIIPGFAGNETNASTAVTPSAPPQSPTPGFNATNETGAGGGGAGGGGSGGTGGGSAAQNKTVQVRLEITNMCSSKPLQGGIILCTTDPGPYYIIVQNSSSEINTSFYNTSGFTFNQTFNASDNALLFNVYVEDLSTLSSPVQNLTADGNATAYFRIGDYTTTTTQTTTIAIMPLYANYSALSPGDWTDLNLRLSTSEKTYYVGTLWLRIG